VQVTRELDLVAKCPNTSGTHSYRVTVFTSDFIPVEEIIAAVGQLANTTGYQEELTVRLSKLLPGCEVETRGWHSGVRTTAVSREGN